MKLIFEWDEGANVRVCGECPTPMHIIMIKAIIIDVITF
jgi:hypothetical protein